MLSKRVGERGCKERGGLYAEKGKKKKKKKKEKKHHVTPLLHSKHMGKREPMKNEKSHKGRVCGELTSYTSSLSASTCWKSFCFLLFTASFKEEMLFLVTLTSKAVPPLHLTHTYFWLMMLVCVCYVTFSVLVCLLVFFIFMYFLFFFQFFFQFFFH